MPDTYIDCEKIGQGAAGDVYKAVDTRLGRPVAIKVLRASLATQSSFVERFRREAIVASRLNHPNIVALYSLEPFEDSWRMVMEYVRGISLGQMISRFGAQRPKYALQIIKQAAAGLAIAHSHQIIHRDIKPNNILLSDAGVVKVTDFGLAKVLHEDSDLTRLGGVVGTPRYMSPEQVEGEVLNEQTDIYSLGVVLIELISGHPIFEYSDPFVIMRKISSGDLPDVRRWTPNIDPMIVRIIAKMTARDLGVRYASATSLAKDIQAYFETGQATLARELELNSDSNVDPSGPIGAVASTRDSAYEGTVVLHYIREDSAHAQRIADAARAERYRVYRYLHAPTSANNSIDLSALDPSRQICLLRIVSPEYLARGGLQAAGPAATPDLRRLSVVVQPLPKGNLVGAGLVIDISQSAESPHLRVREWFNSWGSPDRTAPKRAPDSSPQITGAPAVPPGTLRTNKKLLANIQQLFAEGARVIGIAPERRGQVGVGTSTLAVAYVHESASVYSRVWWLRAANREQLVADYLNIGSSLDIPGYSDLNYPGQLRAIKKWLSVNDRWLLVFDGARNPNLIASLLPSSPNGHVLVPSQSTNWPASAVRVQLPSFSRIESIEYLGRCTGLHPDRTAHKIAEALGDLPLGINIAAQYIAHRKISYRAYWELFRERHALLWSAEPESQRSVDGLGTAIHLTLEQLEVESPKSFALANICAYFASHGLPLVELQGAVELLPRLLSDGARSGADFGAVLDLLSCLGIFAADGTRYSMHEAIQQFFRLVAGGLESDQPKNSVGFSRLSNRELGSQFDKIDWLQFGLAVAGQVAEQYLNGARSASDFANFRAHARNVARYAKRSAHTQPLRGTILHALAKNSADRQESQRAALDFEATIAVKEAVVGRVHPDISSLYKNLGAQKEDLADLRGAVDALGAGLQIDRALDRKGDPARAGLLRKMATLATKLEAYSEARSYLEEALKIDLNSIGSPSAEVGYDHALIGGVLEALEFFPAALEQYAEALKNYDKAYGPTHESVGRAARSLGMLLLKMGEPAEARQYFKRALGAAIAQYGEAHSIVAADYERMGRIEVDLKMPRMAKTHFEAALSIHRRLYGARHLRIADNLREIADVLRMEGDDDRAVDYYRQALSDYEHVLGPDHDRTRETVRAIEEISGDVLNGKI